MRATTVSSRQAGVALVALSVLLPRAARPLDCNKASSASERAICGDEVLLDLEGRLNREYNYNLARTRSSPDARERLLAQQEAWLAQREECGSEVACLKRSIETRLDVLAGTAAPEWHGPFLVRAERAPRWDVVYPVIVSGPSGQSIAALEAVLERARQDGVVGCIEGTGANEELSYTWRSYVVYADERFFTLQDYWDFWCGGPYPDAGHSFSTYLVSSGRKLELSDAMSDALTSERMNELVRKRFPTELDSEDCEYDDRTIYSLAVVEGGLLFKTSFPHAMRACEFHVTLPWTDLQSFISPRGPLAQCP